MNPDDKLKLIDPSCSQLSESRQCRLLDLSRSRFYYKPKGIDQVELEQMRILDELYLENPTRGTRWISKELKKLGYQADRHHTRTLMRRMRLKTVYCRPRTTIMEKGRAIDNVFIERFWRTIKYDKLYLYTIENGHHALELCEEFIKYYNYKRMHSSINDKTPMQV